MANLAPAHRGDHVSTVPAMYRSDIRAVGDLAGEGLAAGGALIAEMHAGIAGRPFGVLGPMAAPVRVMQPPCKSPSAGPGSARRLKAVTI